MGKLARLGKNDFTACYRLFGKYSKPMNMESVSEKCVGQLKRLLADNTERFRGYEYLAERISYPDLKELFARYAYQSARFSSDISREIIALGGTPHKKEAVPGHLHRNWVHIRNALDSGDKKQILESCGMAEQSLLNAYHRALSREDIRYSSDCLVLLEDQRAEVQNACYSIKALCKFFV